MRIGVPKEIKDHEFRVGLVPSGVRALCQAGHSVAVQKGAGLAIGFTDAQYSQAGARLVDTAAEAYAGDLVVKIKEPQAAEYPLLRPGLALFTFLHLAAAPELAARLRETRVTALAYETVRDAAGRLPLLAPMSQIAGRLAIQAGAAALTLINSGNGTLLPGVPGVPPGKVVILGAGIVGSNAARMAIGMGADVTLLDVDIARLGRLEDLFGSRIKTCYSEPDSVARETAGADLLIGAVLVPGAHAPHLLDRSLIGTMKPGSALVDVAIDQGGCAETSRPTTHGQPTYVEEGVVHYCVTNMPSAVARTSTLALAQATFPFIAQIAAAGVQQALRNDPGLAAGLNFFDGHCTHATLAQELGTPYLPPLAVLDC